MNFSLKFGRWMRKNWATLYLHLLLHELRRRCYSITVNYWMVFCSKFVRLKMIFKVSRWEGFLDPLQQKSFCDFNLDFWELRLVRRRPRTKPKEEENTRWKVFRNICFFKTQNCIYGWTSTRTCNYPDIKNWNFIRNARIYPNMIRLVVWKYPDTIVFNE